MSLGQPCDFVPRSDQQNVVAPSSIPLAIVGVPVAPNFADTRNPHVFLCVVESHNGSNLHFPDGCQCPASFHVLTGYSSVLLS